MVRLLDRQRLLQVGLQAGQVPQVQVPVVRLGEVLPLLPVLPALVAVALAVHVILAVLQEQVAAVIVVLVAVV